MSAYRGSAPDPRMRQVPVDFGVSEVPNSLKEPSMSTEATTTVIGRVVRIVDTNKAKFAFLAPFILAMGGTLASWVVTGDLNEAEIRTAVSGLVLSAAGGLGAFFKSSDEAVVEVPVDPATPPLASNVTPAGERPAQTTGPYDFT